MRIENREQLFLTEEEVKILQKAEELVSEILYNSADYGEIEELASDAQDSLRGLIYKYSPE